MGATTALLALSLSLFWPGVAAYDSVEQFKQVLSGVYTDWHPAIMARLWAALHAALRGGAWPMLALQLAIYWLGLGALAAALARVGRNRAALAVLAIAIWPPVLGWMAAVLKDAQMVAAMIAAFGLIGHWRLRGRSVPAWAGVTAGVLLAYAVLVRSNASFAVVPLAVMLIGRGGALARAGMITALSMMVLGASGAINHGVFGAEATSVTQTEALYDLAGIAVRADDPESTGLTARAAAVLRARRCSKAFFWDPLGGSDDCAAEMAALRDLPTDELYRRLAGAAVAHPLAYLAHRFGHFNSTERWLVPSGWPSGEPLVRSEPNAVGLADPGLAGQAFLRAAGVLARTPLGWPICWTVLALGGLSVALRRTAEPARDLALALFVSAIALEASFLVLSIASDARYHLWTMLAVPLALVLLAPVRAGERRALALTGAALAMVVMGGAATRLLLPRAPDSYRAMLAA